MNLTDNVKLAAMTLLITLALLFSTLSVEGVKVPAFQPSAQQVHSLAEGAAPADASPAAHGVSGSDDGIVKFVGSHQNHLLRLEHSLSRDHQSGSVVYELVMSWSQQAILLLLCGLLFYAALFYPGTSFRDHFAGIHRRRLQRRHLQYRFAQSFLA
ncbi:hypothetical protein QO202_13645 [Aeromonas caviae]|uniref:hypothetical protein n=1 Tax=Aeromonas caviae TaxID=648 RepID=UPI002648905D|nr:hypothetical protein [Aeromonas caviae]MDN6869059.1 hypothetical protein [Aeromonas caviae]